jgi:hypothetical protein
VHSGISGFASSFNWKLTDNINNSTFPTQLAGQGGLKNYFMAKTVLSKWSKVFKKGRIPSLDRIF